MIHRSFLVGCLFHFTLMNIIIERLRSSDYPLQGYKIFLYNGLDKARLSSHVLRLLYVILFQNTLLSFKCYQARRSIALNNHKSTFKRKKMYFWNKTVKVLFLYTHAYHNLNNERNVYLHTNNIFAIFC